MEAGAPQQPDNDRPHRDRARLGAWCQVAGAILAVVTLTCALFGVITAMLAIALAVPAALLIVGGLILAAPGDASAGQRFGFRVGLRFGALLSQIRSIFRSRGGGLAKVLTSRRRLR
jgi:hypothetical protein